MEHNEQTFELVLLPPPVSMYYGELATAVKYTRQWRNFVEV